MAEYEGGTSWWTVALTAILGIATAVGGFLLARKLNLFGLGAGNANPAIGSGTSVEATVEPPFKKGMSMTEAKKIASDSAIIKDESRRNQLSLVLDFIAKDAQQGLSQTQLSGTGSSGLTRKPFVHHEFLNVVGFADESYRYSFMNMVSVNKMLEVTSSLDDAKKLFPDMSHKEYQSLRTSLQGYAGDKNTSMTLQDLNAMNDKLRAARKEDEKDKAAKPALSASAPSVSPAVADAAAGVRPQGVSGAVSADVATSKSAPAGVATAIPAPTAPALAASGVR